MKFSPLLLAFLPFFLAIAPKAEAQAVSSPAPASSPARQPWTFLIYGACDNNAEVDGNFFAFLDGVRAAMTDDCGVNVVLFLDRSDKYSTNARTLGEDFTDARLYHVQNARCTRLAGGAEFPEIKLDGTFEPDSADPKHIEKSIAFVKAHFPAERYALMLYGHASGAAMCPDEDARKEIGFAELTDVVSSGAAVDLMALELCAMGGIEIAYQWRPGNGGFSTQSLVAIPNSGPALDWSRVFKRLRKGGSGSVADPSKLTGQDLAKLIIEEGGEGRREAKETHESIGAYDLTKAAAVKAAVDALAVALARDAASKKTAGEVRGPGPDGYTLNYSNNRLDRGPFVDLYDLCVRLAACERLAEPSRTAAKRVLPPLDAFVLASFGGSDLPRFEPGKCGVYITFPDGDARVKQRNGDVRVWSMLRHYTPLPVPEFYGKLAWCADGAKAGNGQVENWFELLDVWYDDVKNDPKGFNNYAP